MTEYSVDHPTAVEQSWEREGGREGERAGKNTEITQVSHNSDLSMEEVHTHREGLAGACGTAGGGADEAGV